MRTVLSEVMTGEAAALYERLLRAGELRFAEHPDLRESTPASELVKRGFARERHAGAAALVPVGPAHAVDNAIFEIQRQIFEQYRTLLRLREETERLQRRYLTPQHHAVPESAVQLVEPAEAEALSLQLRRSARREVACIKTEHAGWPSDPVAAGPPPDGMAAREVPCRTIFPRTLLESPGMKQRLNDTNQAGREYRVYPALPAAMIVIDDGAALLPLGSAAVGGAALVRAPAIVACLRAYFELLWSRSVPLAGAAGTLSPEEGQVLRLVLIGMTDQAIARHLGVSERTVRRRIGTLMRVLGVDNRVTMAVTATREGWG